MLTMASEIGPSRTLRPRRGATLFGDRRGLAASEYALIAAGLAVIAGGATIAFRSNLLEAFAEIGSQIIGTSDQMAGRARNAATSAESARTGDGDQREYRYRD